MITRPGDLCRHQNCITTITSQGVLLLKLMYKPMVLRQKYRHRDRDRDEKAAKHHDNDPPGRVVVELDVQPDGARAEVAIRDAIGQRPGEPDDNGENADDPEQDAR